MTKYTHKGKANEPEGGHGIVRDLFVPEAAVAIPAGQRIIVAVDVQLFWTKPGEEKPEDTLIDRRVTVRLNCGHAKQVAVPLGASLPTEGQTASCLRRECAPAVLED